MTVRRLPIPLLALLSAIVVLAACQPAASPTAVPTEEPAAPTQPPEVPAKASPTPEPPAGTDTPTPTSPTGRYRVQLSAMEVLGVDAGYYRLKLDADGSYSIDWAPFREQDGLVGVSGSYVVNGNQIVVSDVGGFAACQEVDGLSGTYEWSFSGDALVLVPVEDTCEVRVYVLSTLPIPREP